MNDEVALQPRTRSPRPGILARARWVLAALWRGIRWFLEVVGLLQPTEPEQAAQTRHFKLTYDQFRALLSANHSFLEETADLEQKLEGNDVFDRGYVTRKVVRAVAYVYRMATSLNAIGRGRYPGLQPALDRLTKLLEGIVEEKAPQQVGAICLDLRATRADDDAQCGGKMANLGEVANVVGLPVPEGFTITTQAYRRVLEDGDLGPKILREHQRLLGVEDAAEVSDALRSAILGAGLPEDVRGEIERAVAAVVAGAGPSVRLAVRSSAVGEDGARSFAGQYSTELQVAPADVPAAYLRVLASLYATDAICYRLFHGVGGEAAAMAVGCLVMVDAVTSGVCFSRNPTRPDAPEVLIHAVAGLGSTLVDGSTTPEIIVVSRDGTEAKVLRPAGPDGCGFDLARAKELSRLALTLEAHFGCAQDIEWALDPCGRLVVLQSRPLRLTVAASVDPGPVEGATVLVAGGETACPGIGVGPAFHLQEDGDLGAFPKGAVLIAKRSSPRFVRLMDRTAAILTDGGSSTGHMASLAREFRVPTLVGTGEGSHAIAPGTLVTVDARARFVYAGEVAALGRQQVAVAPLAPGRMVHAPSYQLLRRVAQHIVPLNLTDPRSASFTPAHAQTLHDLARYIHEKSYDEMFGMGESLGDLRPTCFKLDVFLPIDLYVIDLGGGISPRTHGQILRRADVVSPPLRALLEGMLHKDIPRSGPRPMDLRGFASIMMRHALTSPESERTFRDPCYAIVSDRYLNYTARVGYHFSVIDTYCGKTPNKNYISFRFQGGAAEQDRRCRRALAISEILRERGFTVDVKQDLVSARLTRGSREEIEAHLDMLGRLLQFMRQLDVAMVHDGSVAFVRDAFLSGKYDLSTS